MVWYRGVTPFGPQGWQAEADTELTLSASQCCFFVKFSAIAYFELPVFKVALFAPKLGNFCPEAMLFWTKNWPFLLQSHAVLDKS